MYGRGMRARSVRAGPPVDEEELAGHEGRLGRREVNDRTGNILPRREPPEWRPRHLDLAKARIPPHALAGQVGLDEARSDGVHRDPAGRKLEGERLRERDDATLRRAVGDALDAAKHPIDGGHVDHAAAVVQERERGLGDERDALEIRVDHGVPPGLVESGEVGRDVRPRVVDEDVDAFPLPLDARETIADRGAVADLEPEGQGSPPFRGDVARDGCAVIGVPRCDSDVGAGVGEGERDGAADAPGASGDQRTLAVQVEWPAHISVAGYVRWPPSRPRSTRPPTTTPPTSSRRRRS